MNSIDVTKTVKGSAQRRFYTTGLTIGVFLAAMENYDALKIAGFIVCLALTTTSLLQRQRIQKRQLVLSGIAMILLLGPMIFNSVGCFAGYGTVLLFATLKLIVAITLVLNIPNTYLSSSLINAATLHSAFFALHLIFLYLGLGQHWDSLIQLETSTNFILGLSRPTGLFDEPSLFGMTILAMLISAYILNPKTSRNPFLLLTFSVPVYLVFATYLLNTIKKTKLYLKIGIVTMSLAAIAIGTFTFLKRESLVSQSPLLLRINHLAYFIDSPNLIKGSGFCSAYGRLDRDLSRDELRNRALGNFKDAGQLLHMADLLGPIPTCLFFALTAFRLSLKKFVLFMVYMIVSKVVFFSFAGWLIIAVSLKLTPKNSEN